ncbi:M56 family metallopeptidase [Streptomyces sp. 5-10]|uniref:M56 family metallopeptidase n=1 Tax=Streptomyces sp. 5-10 TaxID=878925 RepID=UPI00168A4A5C|nr:M56 family metallopeptidase [Streptomyces sp. 5-10]MBD3007214.1 M56 family metallopeptidase [Streptomyces sp. 5-10]
MTVRHALWSSAGTAVLRCCLVPLPSPLMGRILGGLCLAGAGMGMAVAVRGAFVGGRTLGRMCKEWRDHVATLDVLASPLPGLPTVVLDHAAPAAYCVPTRGGRIVITSGALRRLTESEGAAVVEHERAHLRGRHHLMTAITTSLARAFPRVPLVRLARPAVARLVELAADDWASRRCRSDVVIAALCVLGAETNTPRALQSGNEGVPERIRRLRRMPADGVVRVVVPTAVALSVVASLPLISVWAWAGGC